MPKKRRKSRVNQAGNYTNAKGKQRAKYTKKIARKVRRA
jgi:hypothetical protein